MPLYDEARLLRLLRLLRAPPLEWVRRAQRIPLASAPLTASDLEELAARFERDPWFRREFDADPVAAVRAAGMQELGLRLAYELGELLALAERVARDAGRRDELTAAIGSEGTAVANPESLLQVLVGAGDSPDVVAHAQGRDRLEERALLLLLRSGAVADELRAALS